MEKNIYNTLWVAFRESDLRRYLGIFWRLSAHSSPSLGQLSFQEEKVLAPDHQQVRDRASGIRPQTLTRFYKPLIPGKARETPFPHCSESTDLSLLSFSLHKPFPSVFSSLISKMSVFTLAIYCLTTSNFFDSWT